MHSIRWKIATHDIRQKKLEKWINKENKFITVFRNKKETCDRFLMIMAQYYGTG